MLYSLYVITHSCFNMDILYLSRTVGILAKINKYILRSDVSFIGII